MKTLTKIAIILAFFVAIIAISTISNAATVRVTGEVLNIRREPSTSSDVIAMLSEGVECELLGEEGDFYQVRYQNYTGYISKAYSEIVGEESNQTTNNEQQSEENSQTTNEVSAEVETTENRSQEANTTENTTETSAENQKKLSQDADIRILPLIYSSVIGNAKTNDVVTIITEINGWSYVQTNEINGWVRTDILVNLDATTTNNTQTNSEQDSQNNQGNQNTQNDTNSEVERRTAYINETYVNVRSGPSTDDDRIMVLSLNAEVTIIGEDGDWYRVEVGDETGYVSKEFVSDTQTETTSRSSEVRRTENKEDIIEETNNETEKEVVSDNSQSGQAVVEYAKQYLGYPYVYGAAGSSSFDCSGFTMYVYNHFGINLPHGATSQSRYGTKVAKSELKAGDIVFLTDYETGVGIGHCGIYIGDGDFIHASTTGYKVRISSLDVEYAGRFYSAIRLL